MANPKLATTDYVDGEVAKKQGYFADVAVNETSGNRELSLKDATDNVVGQIIAQKEGGVLFKDVATPIEATDGANKGYADNNFANALKGTASGASVRLNGVSPIEHILGVKVRSKNLIPYPYIENRTQPINGITWTLNSDGSITANGTATGNSTYWLTRKSLIPGQTYTLSSGLSVPVTGCTSVANYYPKGSTNYQTWLSALTSKTGVFPSDGDRLACYCLVTQGTTVENVVFKPQIEEGSTATAYTLNISDFSTVNVTRCGKNLVSVMSLYPTITNNDTPIYFRAGETYTFSMTSTYEQYRLMLFGTDINGTAFDATSQDAGKYIATMYTGATGRLQHASTQTSKILSLKCNTDCIITAIVLWNIASESNKTYSDVQLELGSTATAYESYQGQNYTPNSDGSVSNVKSLSPITTLLTNNVGAIIDCTYNQDSSALIGNIDAILGTMFNDVPIEQAQAQSDEAQIQTTTEGVDE